jgi:hypothetical protein
MEIEGGSKNVMAMRGDWLVPHVTLCLKHKHPLVTLWKETNPTARYDAAHQLSKVTQPIVSGQFDEHLRDETDFDIWLDNMLTFRAERNWLTQFPLHAACNFCLMLGTSLLRHEMSSPSSVLPEDRWAVYQMGFDVAKHGERAIRDALMGLQNLAGGPHDGPKKIFPKMYDQLAYEFIEDPDYDVCRHILRSHMLETWPLGVGDELLGEPVTERKLHSVRTAAHATGIDQRRLKKILLSEGIISGNSGSYAWEVFDAKQAEDVLNAATTLVSVKTFADGIGATRSQFDLLVAGGVLAPRLHSVKTSGTNAVWDPADGVKFLESVFLGAVPLRQAQHGWVHISKSAMRLKIGPEKIIQGIQDKKIFRIGNHADYDGYAALYVYHDEVASVLSPAHSPHLSIALFAQSVGIRRPRRMRLLILNGHTPATQLLNPKLKIPQLYITREDAEAFHQKFFTPQTMAQAYGKSWQSMIAALRSNGIETFSPDGENYGNIYERHSIEEIFNQPTENK